MHLLMTVNNDIQIQYIALVKVLMVFHNLKRHLFGRAKLVCVGKQSVTRYNN